MNKRNPTPISEEGGTAVAAMASGPVAGQVARRSLFSSALLVMVATLASRILGIFRDIVLASQFGTSAEYGAYKAAFRIPDTLWLLVIGGALGSALIPVFSRFMGQGEEAKAWRLANAILNYCLAALAVCAAVAWIFAPWIVSYLLAPKFPPYLQELTVNLTRMLLVQPFYLGLGGIAWALLYGSERVIWPSVAPLVYNLCIIAGALFLVGPFGIYGVAAGVLIGAFFYFLVQLPALVKLGFYWRPQLDREAPGLGQVLKVLGPRLLGLAAFQANFFVATNLGSRMADGPSRVAAFEYAYQLFMLPHGIFAVSLANIAFPAMARLLGANELAPMKRVLTAALRQIIFLALPASLGLGLLAKPIVEAIFELGRFNETSTELVSQPLFFFSFGLLGYGVVEIMTRAFYALNDTRTPVIIALITVAVNLTLSLLLVGPFYQGGLALALALSTTLEMVLLSWFLRRKIGPLDPDSSTALPVTIFKIVVAGDAMGMAIFVVSRLLEGPLDSGNKLLVLSLTLVMIGFGGAVYFCVAYLLKIEELHKIVRRFLKR